MADNFLGAGLSIETRLKLAVWLDAPGCSDAEDGWGQPIPCPHSEDTPACRCPWIADLARAVDLYRATRPAAADDEHLRKWLADVQAWALRGIDLLRDHPDEIGATALDMALWARGWKGETVRRQLADVARVVDEAIGVRGNVLGTGLWPPEPEAGNPKHRSGAQAALQTLVRDVVAIADRRGGLPAAAVEQILAIALQEAGEPRSDLTIRRYLAAARNPAP